MNQVRLLKAQPYLDAHKIALRTEIHRLKSQGAHPHLHAIIVGENPASLKYLANKQKMCEELGARFSLKSFSVHVAAQDFISHLTQVNADSSTHGCIIQLPVEGEIKKLSLARLIDPQKDVDGFHPENVFGLFQGKIENNLIPCTPKGILSLLKFYHIPLESRHVVILGRSQIVGKPLSLLLTHANATVTLAHSKTHNISQLISTADIVVGAIGRAEFFNDSYFTHAHRPVVIDVGINSSSDGRLVGDFKRSTLEKYTSDFSPVPGGIGPMTVISLIENLVLATKKQIKELP